MIRMSIRSGNRLANGLFIGLLAVLASVGCETNSGQFTTLSASLPQEPPLDLGAPAAVPVSPSTGPIQQSEMGAGREFGSRQNPFRLLPPEAEYDLSQRTEFFLGQAGSWTNPTEVSLASLREIEEPIVIEPVPLWRLSGVIIGEGVLALLDTGLAVHEVRPGTQVPDSEWMVVSIDSEHALLRREGNKLPREFAVGLKGPISGTFPTSGAAAGAGGGLQQGGGAAAAGGGFGQID